MGDLFEFCSDLWRPKTSVPALSCGAVCRFSGTPTCDRQTDIHTTTAYTALAWRRAVKTYAYASRYVLSDPIFLNSLLALLLPSFELSAPYPFVGFFMVALWNRADHYIFALWFLVMVALCNRADHNIFIL